MSTPCSIDEFEKMCVNKCVLCDNKIVLVLVTNIYCYNFCTIVTTQKVIHI